MYRLLNTVVGIGPVLALVIALEIGDINRFRSAGDFASYCRLVDSKRTSNSKK
jgi:transposase